MNRFDKLMKTNMRSKKDAITVRPKKDRRRCPVLSAKKLFAVCIIKMYVLNASNISF